jgi:hypothetical protein
VLLFFFVDVLRGISDPVVATPRRCRDTLASSCVKKPGFAAVAMEPDVIMSCITPSFGGGIP